MTVKRQLGLAIAQAILPALAGEVLGKAYYVAPGGSDGNPGTLEAPWKTLGKAASLMQAGDICHIRAGIYRETLQPANSGTAGAPIVFSAYLGESPLITGADPVTGWSAHTGAIRKARMPWSLGKGQDQVFVDGAMVFQARFPNTGPDPMRPTLASMTATATEITSPALDQPAGTWTGGTVHGWLGSAWTAQGAAVTASVPGRLTVSQASNPWFPGPGKGYVTGVLAALDAPGEWHHQDSTLYLWAPGGGDPGSHSVEAKRRSWTIDLRGRTHVHVKGVRTLAGAIRMDGNNCLLEGVRASYLSHFTHTGSGYDGGYKAAEGWNGVYLGGSGNEVKASVFAYSAGSGIVLHGSGNRVVDCLVHDMDYQGVYSCPVKFGGSGNVLEWSTVRNAGRDILHISGTRHSIRNNDLSYPGMLARDLGVIYTFGVDAEGTEIAWNWVHDNNAGNHVSPGIYIDNECRNYLVHHNVVWNCRGDAGVRVNGPAQGHRIHNNTLFNTDDVGTHTYINDTPGPYEYVKSNNLLVKDPASELVDTAMQDFRLAARSPHVDMGQAIPGITDGFLGAAPDLGAYESGAPAWKAGSRAQFPPVSLSPGTLHRPDRAPATRCGPRLLRGGMVLEAEPSLGAFDSRGRRMLPATPAAGAPPFPLF